MCPADRRRPSNDKMSPHLTLLQFFDYCLLFRFHLFHLITIIIFMSQNDFLNSPLLTLFFFLFHCMCLYQLQQMVVSGELPCTKDESAILAGIQLHIEEAWPEDNPDADACDLFNHVTPRVPSTPPTTSRSAGTSDDNVHHAGSTSSSDKERQDNLRKKKELIRANKAKKLASNRRRGRLVKHLMCFSDYEYNSVSSVCLEDYLPPEYTTSRKIRELIQVS